MSWNLYLYFFLKGIKNDEDKKKKFFEIALTLRVIAIWNFGHWREIFPPLFRKLVAIWILGQLNGMKIGRHMNTRAAEWHENW